MTVSHLILVTPSQFPLLDTYRLPLPHILKYNSPQKSSNMVCEHLNKYVIMHV